MKKFVLLLLVGTLNASVVKQRVLSQLQTPETQDADDAYQVAPASRRQWEYDRIMGLPMDKRNDAFENVKNRMEHGSYWADEAYQVAPDSRRQWEYDRLMGMDND